MQLNTYRLSGRITKWTFHVIPVLILLCALLVHQPVAAQEKRTVNINNMQAEKAFHQLSSIYKVRFFYSGSTINTSQVISIPTGKMSLEEILQYLADHYQFSFKRNNNMISVTARKTVTPLQPGTEKVIQGRVGLFEGNDVIYVPGVTIREAGHQSVAVTDDRGNFSIKLHTEPGTLLISYLGYETTEVETGSHSQVNVTLKQALQSIREVVVSTGYQTMAKKNTTGAYTSITEKEIERRSSQSLNGVLEGAIPGLTLSPTYTGIASNRTPGATSIQIRGGSSLQSDRTSPLIIVDGFQVNQLPQNMNDVASIDVLKDAAAAAIWGAAASNGVIVITTKRGKEGHLRVNYTANTYFTQRPDFSKLGRASSADMVDYDKELYDKGFIMPQIYTNTKSGYSPSYDLLLKLDAGTITAAEYSRQADSLGRMSNKDQVNDLLLQTGVRSNHYLSLAGGGKGYRFLVSGSYDYDKGTMIGSKSDNTQLNTRSDFDLSKNFQVSADINAAFTNNYQSAVSTYDIVELPSYQLLTGTTGNYLYDYTDFNHASNDDLIKKGYYNFGRNLLEDARLANNNAKTMALRTKVSANWKIAKGLSLNGTFLYDRSKTSNKNERDSNSTYVRNTLNQYATLVNNTANFNLPKGDILDQSEYTYSNWAVRTQLNYTNTFKGKHFINILAGIELKKFITEGATARHYGYNDQLLSWQTVDQKTLAKGGLRWWDNSSVPIFDATSYDVFSFRDDRHASYYGTAAYTYNEKYTFTGSYRIDQSNLFGTDPKYRSNPLWSIGGAWDIAKEDFINIPAVSMLKLRATVGLTGNFDKTTTPLLTATQRYQVNLNDFALRVSNYNPKLRWERTRTFNVGMDLGLLRNRFQVTVDAYNKFGYDLFGTQLLDPTVGFTSMKVNAAKMRNTGVELALRGNIIETGDFRWESRLNFGYNKNKILANRMSESNPTINRVSGSSPYVEGYSRESIWSYKWAGLDGSGNPLVYGDKGEKVKVPVLSSLEYSGVYRAPYVGGFTNIFYYHDLFLSMFATYNFGNVMRREMPTMNGYAGASNLNYQIADRWRQPGDELKTDIPSITQSSSAADFYDGRDRAAIYSSNSIMPGDYIRLREVQLGYSLPSRLIKNTVFRGVQVIAQMNNVALWTKNKYGLDPDAVDPLTGGYSLPLPRITTLTVRVDL
ncbi:TonB-linked outer membrane protein, SusC/RagA family [Chitinophaga jiangningensis]|uniref:TonB-linked outer membrane protein, SusC/RagA family n=1 Tax=Chitinophaga jiangningensis TaxID=1419482 RepID=A0A1M7LPS2_9BACT|nr:SusC/RagA family TonB-linked outer membrane protein [Chitinophaga jiangningensis]SHM80102.1 TonB-linked outer membrane protein, SusC/RagA family [Chitinophaga jiangningensis]